MLELAEGELCVNVALELYDRVVFGWGEGILYPCWCYCAALQWKYLPVFQIV